MTIEDIKKKAFESFAFVGVSDSNLDRLKKVLDSIKEKEVLGAFMQLKKNDKGDGLASEVMFFTKTVLYDIVASVNTLDHFTVLIQHIKAVSMNCTSFTSTNDKGEVNKVDNLQMKITYGDTTFIYYNTDSSRFDEILKIKNDIVNLL